MRTIAHCLVMSVALLVGACSGVPRVIRESRLSIVPASLDELAANVRGVGGVVLLGRVTGESLPTDPQTGATIESGVFLSAPQQLDTVEVVDAMGATIGPQLLVLSPSGPETLVDSDGHPADGYILISEDPDAWMRYVLPRDQDVVLFLTQGMDGTFHTTWQAALKPGDVVDGAGTADQRDVPVAELRLP